MAANQNALPSPSAEPDRLAEFVQDAQAEIEESIERGGLQRDQYRHPLRALSAVLGVFPELAREMRAAADGPRQPISDEMMTDLGRTALILVERQVGDLIRHRLRTLLLYLALGVFAISATGFGIGWFVRGDSLEAACISRGLIQTDKAGQRFCAFWLNSAPTNQGSK